MNQNTDDPSPFYALFHGAKEFVLHFPAGEDWCGPVWDETGELDLSQTSVQTDEPVDLVELGNNRYRLSERVLGPFSGLHLYWGDEFIAERSEGNELVLTRVIEPRMFKHYRFISSDIKNDKPIAQCVHRYEGGWETVANGMLTLTVPANAATDFEREIVEKGIVPVGLRLGL